MREVARALGMRFVVRVDDLQSVGDQCERVLRERRRRVVIAGKHQQVAGEQRDVATIG